jgi:hypothetical protein
MADLNTPDGQAWLKERSPLTAADKIKTPLLVIQGANDPRVNVREAEQIVIAARDHGLPVEYVLAPDEGHGFARPVNNMAMFLASEKFFAAHLDGRYQEGGTPEVVSRIKEITVDPKTVVLSKKLDPSAVGAPKPAVDLQAGSYKYQSKIALGAQTLSLNVSGTIKEENGGWTVTEVTDTPAGPATETVTLEKGTLFVRKRALQQGTANIHIDVNGNKAEGAMNIGGRDTPLAVDLGGPLFADGAGARHVIAALPLAEGYSATFRNLDVQKQKGMLMQLKVTGAESVTVPAGAFDTFRVEIASDDGSTKMTLWVSRDSHKPVKQSSTLAAAGGATVITELLL